MTAVLYFSTKTNYISNEAPIRILEVYYLTRVQLVGSSVVVTRVQLITSESFNIQSPNLI